MRARNLKGLDQFESVPASPESYMAVSGLSAIPTLSVVKVDSEGMAALATCNDADVYAACVAVKVDDSFVQVAGSIVGLPLAVGPVYLGESGELTNTAPSVTGQTVYRIGHQTRCGAGLVLVLNIIPICRL